VFKRIQTRLVLLYSALFILVQGATYYALYEITAPQIENQIKQQLIYSRTLIEQTVTDQMQELADGTKLLAADFGFRSAVATGDRATIFSALENLSVRIGADHAKLISLENEIIADTNDPEFKETLSFKNEDLIEIADAEDQAATLMMINGQLTEFVVVPVLAPIPIAWIGVAIDINNARAMALQGLLLEGFDLSFFRQEKPNQGWNLVASTLADSNQDILVATIPANELLGGEPTLREFNGENTMVLSLEFPGIETDKKTVALLQYSMDVAVRPYRSLAIGLSGMVAFGLLILILGSAFIARGVTRPLRVLAEAAQRIKVGNYTPVQQFDNHQEVDQLASSFNHMIGGIAEREIRIRHQAEHDMETGLPNRLYCENYIENLLSDTLLIHKNLTVMIISIQRFATIRNTLGYALGEKLIKHIVPCLEKVALEGDLLARLSTTSFAIVHHTNLPDQSREMAGQLLEQFKDPIHIGEISIDVGLKFGIACLPDDANAAESLLRRATIANLQANDNPTHIARYDGEKDKQYAEQLSLMGEFRSGIEEGQLVFNYQPKINIATGKISQVEALVRWVHPVRGFIPPDDFIPFAEQTGQIQHLTNWGLNTAIKQCGEWQAQNIDLKMAINLSAHDLTNKDLPALIGEMLKLHNVKSKSLVLEVTESAVMQDPDLALGVLFALSDMGLTLSIDDYGTGYSSLSYLKKLPVKEIKIDKSFVLNLATNKEDEILVRSTIDLGHNLGLKVTAEGVEDEKSFEILRKLGCDLAQGYFFSKAVPADELIDFLKSSPYGSLEGFLGEDKEKA
jgi:diguanylate cyclase (GGDEF)-like protein